MASSKSNGASHGLSNGASNGAASSRPPSDSKREVSEGRATAPWILHGRGLVFPCMLPKETAMQYSAYAEDPNELVKFVGGIGAFILVNYTDSPVGPYKELVFIPGMYQYFDSVAGKVKTAHGISRIWVDNQKSVTDARANWGIPKELAEFEWKEPSSSGPGRVTVRHCSNGSRRGVIFDVTFHDNYSPISVPVWTKVPLLPNFDVLNWLPLVQLGDGSHDHLLLTTLSARGWMKPAAMANKPRVDTAILPSVESLYGLCIPSFELQFKEPVELRSEIPASVR